MKIGELDVSKIMLGGTEITSIYLGATQAYDGGSEPQPDPFSKQYLTFVAKENGSFRFSLNDIDYSIDSGNTWTTLASNTSSPTVAIGNTIMWKASGLTPSSPSYGIGTFSSTGRFDVEGNVMSLAYGDNFSGQTTIQNSYQFKGLFSGATNIISAENMILPATTLASNCYQSMFRGCISLTTAPVLSATTLADYCYGQMFSGCTSFTTAPELPATTLAEGCYTRMFYGCRSLNYIKCLATDISASNCTNAWVTSVDATGTFVKAASMNDWTTGVKGIPDGWTVIGE